MGLIDDIAKMQDFSALVPVSSQEVEQIRQKHDSVPADYVDFLVRVGAGNTSGDLPDYKFYSGLISPSTIYDKETAKKLRSILLIGDDYQGYCAGFDAANGWVVVEIDPINKETYQVATTFSEFLRERFLNLDEEEE